MTNKLPQNRVCLAIATAFIVAVLSSGAFAWGHGGGHFGGGHFGHGYGGYYYPGYYGWPYYGPWLPEVTVVEPPIGGYVAYLPDGYTTFLIGNDRYYAYNGVYFRPYSDGYIVVSPPAQNVSAAMQTSPAIKSDAAATSEPKSLASVPAAVHSSDTVTVGVPNVKGGFTSVRLIKQKDGYVGPQGEFYKGHASVDQLKALYGN
jgi:hypothetical protein